MSKNSNRSISVFLCHASEDKQAVRELYQRLTRDGVDVWFDEEKLLPGQDWKLEIPKAVRTSDIVIVCLSKKLVSKEGYIQKELRLALDVADEKPEGTIYIIPVKLDDCEVPDRLNRWQWISLSKEDDYKRLKLSLHTRANEIGAVLQPKIASFSPSQMAAVLGSNVNHPPKPADSYQNQSEKKNYEEISQPVAKAKKGFKVKRRFSPILIILTAIVVITGSVSIWGQNLIEKYILDPANANNYEKNYQLALASAAGAIGQSDPATIRHAWESTLYYLDKAEEYRNTPESQALRQQAQAALDGLDGIIRLDFRPAISGGLGQSAEITHMAATGSDLYMLDSARGNILRAFLTSQGYAMDPAFQCGPGTYGGQPVSALVDLAAMPGGNLHNAAIAAMDAAGTLLYCAPGMVPLAYPLAAPSLGWETITGFTLSADGKALFALDSKAVWIYGYDDEQKTFIDPIAFFGEQAPQNMNQAIDLAANGSDLFLLFSDGHVTVCTFSGLTESKTTCLDPATFVDTRPDHQSGPTITDAVFSQMMFYAPFNTWLYLLEPNTHAIYIVSPHPTSLELGGQFHASWETENTQFQNTPASAMAIDTNRYLFLCVGNQIFYAAMP